MRYEEKTFVEKEREREMRHIDGKPARDARKVRFAFRLGDGSLLELPECKLSTAAIVFGAFCLIVYVLCAVFL